MASFGKFTGNTIGEAAAFAAGVAIAPLLEPVVQELRNQSWQEAPSRPLDPATAAQGVAEHKIAEGAGASEAAMSGIGATPFANLVAIMRKAPGIAEGLHLIQRGQLAPSDFLTVLQRNGLEDEFITAYQNLSATGLRPWDVPLSPQELAVGIVRSLVPDPGFLPVTLDTEGGKVQSYTPANIDAVKEAAESGTDSERLRVMVGSFGRPPGPVETARATFRQIIDRADFNRGILESDIRPEWADALFEVAREILTAHDWVELHLRGYITKQEMYDGTALHGMSPEDTDRLFNVLGRPLTVHQITTGLARGGTFQPVPGELTDPYEASVHESNIKPAYYDLAIANKYTLPGYFVIKAMLTAGTITEAEGAQLFKEEGWPPDLAEKAAAALAPAGSTGKRLTQSQIHAAFKAGTLSEADALARLEQDGYSPGDAQLLVDTWQV